MEELRRAGRLRRNDWRILLHKLRVYPEGAVFSEPTARPSFVSLPDMPRMMWGKEQEAWAESVGDDLSPILEVSEGRVLAYWHRKLVRETRVAAISERWTSLKDASASHQTLEDRFDNLPRVIQLGMQAALYDVSDPTCVAAFSPHSMHGDPKYLLIFCPLVAANLGWKKVPTVAHTYKSDDGTVMAKSIWWRDGLPQPIEGDENSAEGQFVFLTADGNTIFEQKHGEIKLANFVARQIMADKNDGGSLRRSASDC